MTASPFDPRRQSRLTLSLIFAAALWPLAWIAADSPAADARATREEARVALRRAIRFFREDVSVEGGYVWRYSADLSKREGEGKVDAKTAWIEPPATPSVGSAYLEVFEICGEPSALAAARETAQALLRGQLHSGGWCERIDFDPAARRKRAYLVDDKPAGKARDVSILDDDRTQSVIRFLASYDRATRFGEREVGASARRAIDALVDAQHRNGAWAQSFRGPAEDTGRPASLRASLRESGEYPRIKQYWTYYTLNDNVVRDCITTLLLAAEIYDERRYTEAARRAGEFLLLAQLPEPQPGWAQQYDHDMHPAWARKFEPPAISGSEGPNVLRSLLDLYDRTGEDRFLEPIPRALRYYRSSRLENGRWARFYELGTNRPLYLDSRYELTYSDDDLPTHYGFHVTLDLESISRRHDSARKNGPARGRTGRKETREAPRRPSPLKIRALIDALDARGAWVEEGKLRYWGKTDSTRQIIDPRTFARNIVTLSRHIGR